jgi:hypothetical protein
LERKTRYAQYKLGLSVRHQRTYLPYWLRVDTPIRIFGGFSRFALADESWYGWDFAGRLIEDEYPPAVANMLLEF